ncbi:hypothetical protein [Saccharospirillum impatiens]|uniref:hypothetical protein n=1 Tax=Saccharospirillum impatiens TaxID=169438 RepID=UPI00048BDCD3|nr:hypothetical protein [Saccharospirillum impatiens]
MLLFLIFPVLVAGFFACHIHPIHSYKLHRYEGQYLYLKSAELGIKCFAIALPTAIVAHYWVPDSISFHYFSINLYLSAQLTDAMNSMGATDNSEAAKLAWFFILSALTFLAAFVTKAWGHISLYRRFGTWSSKITKLYVIGEILSDSPLDDLLFKLSLHKDKYAMLTMRDRKVYVGKVIDLGEPTETNGMDQDISIMPLMSGYRDTDTLKVEFQTFYDEIESDIYLSLRQDAIISATEFNFEAYRKWNAKVKDGQRDTVDTMA